MSPFKINSKSKSVYATRRITNLKESPSFLNTNPREESHACIYFKSVLISRSAAKASVARSSSAISIYIGIYLCVHTRGKKEPPVEKLCTWKTSRDLSSRFTSATSQTRLFSISLSLSPHRILLQTAPPPFSLSSHTHTHAHTRIRSIDISLRTAASFQRDRGRNSSLRCPTRHR